MIELAENRYGKSRVRLMKVTRHEHGNDLREWTVQVLLKGDFDSAHLDGDNSKILPTDTMKNTVYSVARTSTATSMEDYAKELADFLLGRNPQVESASIRVESTLWKRLTVDGKPHPSAFMRGSGELQTTSVERAQGGAFQYPLRPRQPRSAQDRKLRLRRLHQGFADHAAGDKGPPLRHRRSARSGATLSNDLDFDAVRTTLRETMLRTFANHESKSVQQTLYAMAESALEDVAEIDEIELIMPNKHCLLVDLSRFGQDNPNEIFVPTDEPHGYIEARVRRKP